MTGKELVEARVAGRRDFSGANLRGADLDHASLPLSCGGLRMRIDRRLAAQMAYHFCGQDCDDPDYAAARAAVLDFANSFRRAGERGRLERGEA
jgi:uncharacterized protein YjbI with pentapeptide repeats